MLSRVFKALTPLLQETRGVCCHGNVIIIVSLSLDADFGMVCSGYVGRDFLRANRFLHVAIVCGWMCMCVFMESYYTWEADCVCVCVCVLLHTTQRSVMRLLSASIHSCAGLKIWGDLERVRNHIALRFCWQQPPNIVPPSRLFCWGDILIFLALVCVTGINITSIHSEGEKQSLQTSNKSEMK